MFVMVVVVALVRANIIHLIDTSALRASFDRTVL